MYKCVYSNIYEQNKVKFKKFWLLIALFLVKNLLFLFLEFVLECHYSNVLIMPQIPKRYYYSMLIMPQMPECYKMCQKFANYKFLANSYFFVFLLFFSIYIQTFRSIGEPRLNPT
jgi:hypothetical protein